MRSHVAAGGGKRALQDSSASSSPSPSPYAGGGESSVVLPDGESETESSKAPPLRRSKRRSRPPEPRPSDPGPASSVSDTTPEDDVARCLMMLSRDVWTAGGDRRDQDEHSVRSEEFADSIRSRTRGRKIHQCSVCFRIFDSGQALGGHKRSHPPHNSAPRPLAAAIPTSKFASEIIIDLNHPAPADEEGELSAVSYAPR